MKGDFTRDTFNSDKHYQQVLMQQGRVQLDADWNEQSAIAARRDETTAADLIGKCGGPAENAAFGIITTPAVLAALPADPVTPIRQFALSAGRYYVDGIQCEADQRFLFSWQSDHRETAALPAGNYLIYLDVWQRHLTVHEDREIREAALGGPDTTTRVKTVWQVRAAALDAKLDPNNPPNDPCHLAASEFDQRQREVLPQLAAKTTDATPDDDPCTVPASAGYRGLENQLYRVEIHESGVLDTATFKWSRENGTVVTRITHNAVVQINGVDVNRLTVTGTGPDDHLGFKKGSLVEILHESEELEGMPGSLALVDHVDDATGQITLAQFGTHSMPVAIDLESNPRLRRWEGFGVVAVDPVVNNGFLGLENGIEIKFDQPSDAEFRTGDYWQIAARTASPDAQSGRIEWPGGAVPEFLPPRGIVHHYCRLGVVSVSVNITVSDDGTVSEDRTVTIVSDCRCLWPALTVIPRLFYVSGDGQEVMPNLTASEGTRFKLPRPLIVGVANGHCLERATGVRFDVVSPSTGRVVVSGGSPTEASAVVPLDSEGLAKCDFYLDGVNYSQHVEARMLDELSQPVSMPIRFNATLSLATAVAYDPDNCAGLANQVTVQAAIDQLAGQVSLHKVSGDAQSGPAGQPLPQEIVLQVANHCGPANGVPVQFTVRVGGGSVSPPQPVITGTHGRAACKWILGSSTATQELEAAIADKSRPTAAPVSVRFTAQVPNAEAPEPGMRIKGVLLLGAAPAVPLRLGQLVSVSDLKAGLRIDCDRKVDPATVLDRGTVVTGAASRGEPTCYVTVEVPIPLTEDQRSLWGRQGLVGYAPVVLAADVKADENQIFWVLSSAAHQGLQRALGQVKEFKLGDRILARLTLKGNFIWAHGERGEERLYLDGETFRLPTGLNGNDVKLPSGDNRRGGDFEMWFWLVQDFVQ